MILSFRKISSLRSSISPWNQSQIQWLLIPWNRLEVLFHNLPFSPISTINLSFDLIKFEEIIINFPNSLWIRPLFTIIPLNPRYFHQIGKFGIIFDTRPCEINDLAVLSHHPTNVISLILSSILLILPAVFHMHYKTENPKMVILWKLSPRSMLWLTMQNLPQFVNQSCWIKRKISKDITAAMTTCKCPNLCFSLNNKFLLYDDWPILHKSFLIILSIW